jgi:DNA-binding beta-propeller fold protein YncE
VTAPAPRLEGAGRWGREGTGDAEFLGPFGVHASAPGRTPASGGATEVFVADDLGHSVQVFDATGRFLRRFGKQGTAPGEFSFPDQVLEREDGKLIVCDTGNNRLQILGRDGDFIAQRRRWGFLRDQLREPAGRCEGWKGPRLRGRLGTPQDLRLRRGPRVPGRVGEGRPGVPASCGVPSASPSIGRGASLSPTRETTASRSSRRTEQCRRTEARLQGSSRAPRALRSIPRGASSSPTRAAAASSASRRPEISSERTAGWALPRTYWKPHGASRSDAADRLYVVDTGRHEVRVFQVR